MVQGLSLKAELEARRGNLRRAGKLVTTRPAEDAAAGSAAERVQVLCNMGYVQHREGKHHTAALCFSKALQTAAASRAPLLPAVRPSAACQHAGAWPHMRTATASELHHRGDHGRKSAQGVTCCGSPVSRMPSRCSWGRSMCQTQT